MQKLPHGLVDLLWSILLHPVTAVSNVPGEERAREREREGERERGREREKHISVCIIATGKKFNNYIFNT